MIFTSLFSKVPLMERSIADELLEAIWRHGSIDPRRNAFIIAETGEQVTYRQLYLASLSIASYLQEKLGFGRGDLACAVMRNCWEYFALFFGCALCGGGLSGASPLFTDFEFHQQFSDSRAKLIVCMESSLETVLKAAKNCPQLRMIIIVGGSKRSGQVNGLQLISFDELLTAQPTITKTCQKVDLKKDVVLLPYSSGTTGPPKVFAYFNTGVLLLVKIHYKRVTHYLKMKFSSSQQKINIGQYFTSLWWVFYRQKKADIKTRKNKTNHDIIIRKSDLLTHRMLKIAFAHYDQQIAKRMDPSWDWRRENMQLVLPFYHNFGFTTTMICLMAGSTGIIIRRYEPRIFLRTIQDYKIRLIFMVPPMILLLAKSDLVREFDLSSLTFIQTGAAPLSREIIETVQKRVPNIKQISQGYGMTELSFGNHLPVYGEADMNGSGKLLANCEMKIRDLKTGAWLGVDQPGEIYIKGPIRMIGYFNKPDATRETIDEDGFVRTGDVGRVDVSGQIFIVDRIKELIKVKGYQVAPAELEALLLTDNRIKDCAVFGVPHVTNGEAPKAFVVRANSTLSKQEVLDYVKARAAQYKHLCDVEFINEIPKSPSGKILRRQLRELVKAKL